MTLDYQIAFLFRCLFFGQVDVVFERPKRRVPTPDPSSERVSPSDPPPTLRAQESAPRPPPHHHSSSFRFRSPSPPPFPRPRGDRIVDVNDTPAKVSQSGLESFLPSGLEPVSRVIHFLSTTKTSLKVSR